MSSCGSNGFALGLSLHASREASGAEPPIESRTKFSFCLVIISNL
uniref:Uncharacterized protein n=1 Tax=Arundo donax TaxID=35708 RepID=A0A0A8ZQR2_ARUDO